MHFNQSFLLENQVSGNGQDILDQPGCAKTSEGAIREHPRGRPSREVVNDIGQEDEDFLGIQAFFTSFAQFQTSLIGLNFGFTGPPVIIVFDHLGQ